MKEDVITNYLTSSEVKTWEEAQKITDVGSVALICEPEAHYNYYGTRGVADLYKETIETPITAHPPHHDKFGHVFEIKSDPKSANKVIRQFNKMKKYFFKDSDRSKPSRVMFELCFTPEYSNYKHLVENKEMYQSLFDNNDNVRITFRHPDMDHVCQLFTTTMNLCSKDFIEYAKNCGVDQFFDLITDESQRGVIQNE